MSYSRPVRGELLKQMRLRRAVSRPTRWQSDNLVEIWGWPVGTVAGLPRAVAGSNVCQHRAQIILDIDAELWVCFEACCGSQSTRLRQITQQEMHDFSLCQMLQQ
ncbi:hypothetical protein [Mycobacterium avium]|nr:hypothetical protein [Mycobacterium avium]PBA69165.1 hypothetical protein CKJ76_24395 [Mycobacterium avium]